MGDRSTNVVYAALAGNVMVSISKFAAASISGSSAMLTEAIHSSADVANQILLLIGNSRSRAVPDDSHAFGYDGEVYFWAFVVAVVVLVAGGAASLYEGMRKLTHPEPLTSPWLSLGVLALSVVFAGSSLWFGLKEYRRVAYRHRLPGFKVSLWRFIELSKDPNLYETLLEDLAALAGIGIAAIGIIASALFDLLWADGTASLGIGLLLIADSWVIARATRSLVADETVAPPLLKDLKCAVEGSPQVRAFADFKTLHLGPRSILVTMTVELTADTIASGAAARDLDQVSEQLKAVDPRVSYVFFRLR
jgi:cation diffusion facilitator family transporter